ncbi:metastasis-associated protein MTA1-like isoform X3 [Anneissia japonica]|uniref:metastasis-associated protein MTA1-like isoform X3 n=1 Tax=Anneissia japonica TaxID=1529436 RepID=UPI001425BB55|nr:metastasis-associated protein MTA1-like isoform X3 [Anneissia japonica]
MAANMYRVGDYVYFETSSSQPYLIRRIEELNKTANGNVEAKVVCFYRRRDIPSSLIQLADKHAMAIEEEMEEALEELAEKDRHQLKHRELFLSRQLETLPATHIRGKCTVTLLNETESLLSYLNKDDAYFYSLVYDPQQKTLLADKGEIRVGSRYQADITPKLKEGESDNRDLSKLESRIWNNDNGLTEKQIDQFLVVARSVGTFARALDCSSSVRQPSLHMSAAAASRDITLFHAMDALHKNNYDIAKAVSTLVPSAGPVLCRDQMEEWSASEANMFEEALEKYGKDFNDIRQDFLPWKSLKSVIEYYYMWKTTDRYVQQKRLKAAEAESKLKQVYIPNYNKPNPNQILNKPGLPHDAQGQLPPGARACESCYTQSSYQWYSWGPANMQCRLCASCWTYWKKCGGLKMPTRLGPPTKRPYIGGSVGRESGRKADMGSEAKKKKLSWLDAPDDVFFHANETTKRLRQQVSNATQKRAARRPYKLMKIAAKYQPPRIVSSASTPANPAGSGQVKLASSAGSKPLASAPSSKLLPSTPANPLPITGVNKMPMTGVTKLAPMVATAPDGNVKSGEPIVID